MSHADEGILHAYLDGELAPAERTRLEAHLAECAACRERLAEERGLIERADRLLTLAALPAGHTHRPAPVQPRRSRPRFVVPGAWAASIAAAFLAGWLLRPTSQFRGAFQLPEAKQMAARPAADYAPGFADSVTTLKPSTSGTHRRESPPALRDSSATLALSNAEARIDSVAAPAPARQSGALPPVVAGKVAGPTLRGAAPTPIPPTTVVAAPPTAFSESRAQGADMAMARSAPIGTTWAVISREPARKALGADLAQIPGLPVRDILQNPTVPGEVMVEQEVAEGTVVQLIQSRMDSVPAGYNLQAKSAARSALYKTVGQIQVRIAGPLATDSLLKLLMLVR